MPLKTKLKDNKLHVRTKLSFAKSRSSGDGFDGMDSKTSGAGRNKRVESRGNSGDNADYGDRFKPSSGKRSEKMRTRDGYKGVGNDGNEWLKRNSGKWTGKSSSRDGRKEVGNDGNERFKRSSGKWSGKSSTRDERKGYGNEGFRSNSGNRSGKMRTKFGRNEVGDDGDEGFKSRNLDNKRKRGYADQSSGNGEKPNWGALLKVAGNKVKEYVGIRKQTFKAKSQNLDVGTEMEERRISKGSELVEKKISIGSSKLKGLDKVEDAGVDRMRKRIGKSIPERRKQLDQNNSKGADILKRSTKKKVQGKKSAGDDAEEVDQKPKKKKRVIRLDPNDTSNKRINDGLPTNDGEEKKKDVPKTSNVELSKNAQFRAICPSPSILSFVEENLLGRRREIEIKRAGYNIELSAPLDNIPFSTSTERERIEEPAFRNKLSFFAAAKASSSFPPADLPEIAFAGRSNVGKSSLLNSLTRQWGVVRTSDKPGLTQTINFFKLEPKLCLVDLPGYGFAYAKEEVKEAWEDLVKEYVSTRVGLKRVCLLVDTKWGMKPRDYELVDLMERYQTKYQIVLTKTDLVFPIDVARRAMQIEESLKQKKAAVQPVMMVSSKSGAGVGSLRTALAKIARFVKP